MTPRRLAVTLWGFPMRRIPAGCALVIALPAGFSGSDELDPVTGEWAADGAQPAGLAHFADNATIGVDGGKATLGTPPSSLCGGATVEATGDDRFRIAFMRRRFVRHRQRAGEPGRPGRRRHPPGHPGRRPG